MYIAYMYNVYMHSYNSILVGCMKFLSQKSNIESVHVCVNSKVYADKQVERGRDTDKVVYVHHFNDSIHNTCSRVLKNLYHINIEIKHFILRHNVSNFFSTIINFRAFLHIYIAFSSLL